MIGLWQISPNGTLSLVARAGLRMKQGSFCGNHGNRPRRNRYFI